MSKLDVMFSNNSDDWATPEDIYNHFINDLKCIDPCPLYSEFDNLNKVCVNSKIYINPPYSKIDKWVDFIYINLINGCTIYLLIPSRTDTKYFHKLMGFDSVKSDLYFIKGRLKFGNSTNSAPFPSVLIKMKYTGYNSINSYFIERERVIEIE